MKYDKKYDKKYNKCNANRRGGSEQRGGERSKLYSAFFSILHFHDLKVEEKYNMKFNMTFNMKYNKKYNKCNRGGGTEQRGGERSELYFALISILHFHDLKCNRNMTRNITGAIEGSSSGRREIQASACFNSAQSRFLTHIQGEFLATLVALHFTPVSE